MVCHRNDRRGIKTATEFRENGPFRLQTNGHSLTKQRAKMLFISMLVSVTNLIADRQIPEAAHLRSGGRHTHCVAGGDGINPFVRSAVRASSIQQKCADILLVKFGNPGRINDSLQSAGPEDIPHLYRIEEWAHACKVAREDCGAIGLIPYDDAPIAYQMDKGIGSPAYVGG